MRFGKLLLRFLYLVLGCAVVILLSAYTCPNSSKAIYYDEKTSPSTKEYPHPLSAVAPVYDYLQRGKYISPIAKTGQSTTNTHKEVVYLNISHCPSRPNYFPEFKAHCWGKCLKGMKCNSPVSLDDINRNRATIRCVANILLVGVRKSGTTDVTKWFKENHQIHYQVSDFRIMEDVCPIEWFENCINIRDCNKSYSLDSLKKGYFHNSPGNLIIDGHIAENSTHLTITTAIQYLAFMGTPATVYYVQLRNPTDRAISYLFHWHSLSGGIKGIFQNLTLNEMDGKFVDGIVQRYLGELKACIAEYGDLYCAYRSTGRDTDMNCLLTHSMYVVYIKEAFKFIPRSQFRFNTTDEYSKDPVAFAKSFTQRYFGVDLPKELANREYSRRTLGKKSPVWKSTLTLLDEFYAPYNKKLADLLDDEKWLFPVDRDL